MSEMRTVRALARLSAHGAVLAPDREGRGFGVFVNGDRRRRPVARLGASETRALASDGAIEAVADGAFVLTPAGASRARRDVAYPSERFVTQHEPIVVRCVVAADGDVRSLRGHDPDGFMRSLAGLRAIEGGAWLSEAELAAANRLRSDWAVSEIGLLRGSDWSAAPMGSNARGPGVAQEVAMVRRCDARRRLADALSGLALPLRRVVERVCLHEDGLEAIERSEGWPARSGKLALKLGLAQLAAAL